MTIECLDQFDAVRRTVPSPGGRLDHAPPVVREIGAAGLWYCIVYSRFSEADADAVIDREIASFKYFKSNSADTVAGVPAGTEFEWKVYGHDQPPDLMERLARRGFNIGEEEALLVMDLAIAPPAQPRPDTEVRAVESAKELSDARAVWEAVFEKDFSHTCLEIAADLALPWHEK